MRKHGHCCCFANLGIGRLLVYLIAGNASRLVASHSDPTTNWKDFVIQLNGADYPNLQKKNHQVKYVI